MCARYGSAKRRSEEIVISASNLISKRQGKAIPTFPKTRTTDSRSKRGKVDRAAPSTGPTPEKKKKDAAAPKNLNSVLKVIPPECYEVSNARGYAYFARNILLWAALSGTLMITDVWWQVGILWTILVQVIVSLFVVGHDAAHGSLFTTTKQNDLIAKLALLPGLHPVEPWKFGHNRCHHGHTARNPMDIVWTPITVDEYAGYSNYEKFRCRVEWNAFGFWAYYLRKIWFNSLMRADVPRKFAEKSKKDRRLVTVYGVVVTMALAALGAFVYGTSAATAIGGALWMVSKVMLIPTVLFMQFIAAAVYFQHIHPDTKWWPRRAWTPYKGQMESTRNIHVPEFINVFFLNILVHVPHHVDMRIPFYHLPKASEAIKAEFHCDETPFTPREYAYVTRTCKLYDYENQCWVPYSTAENVDARAAA